MKFAENRVLRLRSCIAVVHVGTRVEFFDGNLRTSFSINLNYSGIVNLVHHFDGVRSNSQILQKFPEILPEEFYELSDFLHKRKVLIEINEHYSESLLTSSPRLINSLESYFHSTADVINAIIQGQKSHVLIVGLGAVGSWVLHCLIKAGIRSISVMDDDFVESSNLHRQDLFFEKDIGIKKSIAARENIKKAYGVGIKSICKKMLSTEDLEDLSPTPSLIINCADSPSVDATSRIVSDFCLNRKINHIIGGGYNLHLTLIGQAVIPGITACFHCFDNVLSSINSEELFGVKKLNRKSRKIGSLGPVCGISASITSTEAIKLIYGVPLDLLAITNKRLEFSLSNFDFGTFNVQRNTECAHCA